MRLRLIVLVGSLVMLAVAALNLLLIRRSRAGKAEQVTPATLGRSSEGMANLTPKAQQVLALARQEADRFNHHFIGMAHLLLGLTRLNDDVAVNVLKKMGLELETVRLEVEKQVGSGPDQKMTGNIPYTPRVKMVLALAAKEAKAVNHASVGPEHILLGLLREGDGRGDAGVDESECEYRADPSGDTEVSAARGSASWRARLLQVGQRRLRPLE